MMELMHRYFEEQGCSSILKYTENRHSHIHDKRDLDLPVGEDIKDQQRRHKHYVARHCYIPGGNKLLSHGRQSVHHFL